MLAIKFMKLHNMTYKQSVPEQKVLQYDSFSKYITYCMPTLVHNLMNGIEDKTGLRLKISSKNGVNQKRCKKTKFYKSFDLCKDKALLPDDYHMQVFHNLESYSGSTNTDL
eukprot:4111342-Ditylum_brightwellii.AAC.1